MLFTTFLVLHLLNSIVASGGQAAYDTYQTATRWYYQFPPVEIVVVIGAATVHALAGIIQIKRRISRRLEQGSKGTVLPFRVRLHRWCGYIILLIIPGHVMGTRLPGLLNGLPADFSFVYFSIKNWPWFFYPYLLAYGVCGVFHMLHGLIVSLAIFKVRLPAYAIDRKSKPFWITFLTLALLVVLGVFSLGGNFFHPRTDRFPELQFYYEKKFQRTFMPWKENR